MAIITADMIVAINEPRRIVPKFLMPLHVLICNIIKNAVCAINESRIQIPQNMRGLVENFMYGMVPMISTAANGMAA